jgi:hypothetical protein
MKTRRVAIVFLLIMASGFNVIKAQTYLMSNVSVITCSGNFYDTGGAGGNYANNQNFTKTFTPAVVGNMLQFVFTAFNTESGYDFLYIYNGPTIASPLIGTYSGATSPGTIIASNATGQLTFRWTSDGSVVRPGWAATISCVAPCVPPINNDCVNATLLTVNALPLCGQTTICSSIQGSEIINQCTATGINQSVWYKFIATQSNMDVWVDNLVTGSCHLGSIVYNTSACLPGAGNIISCKPNNTTGGTDYWHHLTGLTIGNTYLIQIVYSTTACGTGQTFCISVVAPSQVPGYLHPTIGLAGEYIGTCMVNTCGGQYYDDGGSSGNYVNNITSIYRTFCPNAPGQCVTANINYIDCEESYDPFTIESGPTQNSPVLWTGYKSGNTTITSIDPSGCLTFRFTSDASVTFPGWNISLSCSACGANTTSDNNDCINATSICANTTFVGSSVGPGILSEGCSGCNTSEHFSNWYKFCVSSAGNLQFSLNPTSVLEDYDFALYGPNVICGTLGIPVRCSYSSVAGATGLSNTAFDVSEDVSGDSWVSPIPVFVGQCFYLMLSQWSAGGAGFTVDFTGSTASLDCVILPISLLSFTGDCDDNKVNLKWTTVSEINNDFFTIEKSTDAIDWKFVKKIKGAGNSNQMVDYSTTDKASGNMYYRLKQTDYNGQSETFLPIYTSCSFTPFISVHPNPVLDVLYIEAGDMEVEYTLLTLEGQKVLSGKSKTINMTELSSGVYVLKIISDNENKFFKIIK